MKCKNGVPPKSQGKQKETYILVKRGILNLSAESEARSAVL